MDAPQLVPHPRRLTLTGGSHTLPYHAWIFAHPDVNHEAGVFHRALHAAGLLWDFTALPDATGVGARVAVDASITHPQGYRLTISADGIDVRGGGPAGVYYGCLTLRQLVRQYGSEIPCLEIHDHPDFEARGVMLDISRDKVPTMATLLQLVDKLAHWKINQLQLYTEHTFAYRDHVEVWAQASPLTADEIRMLDAHCRLHHIELVPNQNSLGHMERWLKFRRYQHLAECPDGFPRGRGWSMPTTVNPLDPASIALMASLYDELLPNFTSETLNVGGDEPWELGRGRSKDAVEARGGRVYLEYLQKLHRVVTERGRQMQFWGDIIMHYPELIPELPPDIIAMEWGYEGNHPFDEHGALFANAGIPFYVCPGTSSWNSLVGRTDNAIENLRNAAVNGLKHGAIGYLITDWGDAGHWQMLPVSYLGFMVGAGFSWCYESNQSMDVPALLDRWVFEDSAQVMGRFVYDLGNVYQLVGPKYINGQYLNYALQMPRHEMEYRLDQFTRWGGSAPDLRPATLRDAIRRIDELRADLLSNRMGRVDAELIATEFRHGAAMLRHGARWLLLAQGEGDAHPSALLEEWETLAAQQQSLWLARNRPGGLEDSMRRWNILRSEYRSML